jgi:hypothetical protein
MQAGERKLPGLFRAEVNRPPQNGDLLRQQKNPDRLCMLNTPRVLDFFASLHLTIFEGPPNFEFFNFQWMAWMDLQIEDRKADMGMTLLRTRIESVLAQSCFFWRWTQRMSI